MVARRTARLLAQSALCVLLTLGHAEGATLYVDGACDACTGDADCSYYWCHF